MGSPKGDSIFTGPDKTTRKSHASHFDSSRDAHHHNDGSVRANR